MNISIYTFLYHLVLMFIGTLFAGFLVYLNNLKKDNREILINSINEMDRVCDLFISNKNFHNLSLLKGEKNDYDITECTNLMDILFNSASRIFLLNKNLKEFKKYINEISNAYGYLCEEIAHIKFIKYQHIGINNQKINKYKIEVKNYEFELEESESRINLYYELIILCSIEIKSQLLLIHENNSLLFINTKTKNKKTKNKKLTRKEAFDKSYEKYKILSKSEEKCYECGSFDLAFLIIINSEPIEVSCYVICYSCGEEIHHIMDYELITKKLEYTI